MRDPVIILAPPRSFTSVVCAMLGQHPQLYGLPEVNLFVAETMREREGLISRPRWSEQGLLRAVAQIVSGEQTRQTVMLAQRWLGHRANASCVSVFRELVDHVSPRGLVDKSPRTAMRPEYLYRLSRTFPEASYIHLLRHPRSQGESLWKLGGVMVARQMQALDHSTDPPTIDFQKSWYSTHSTIVTFLEAVPEERKLQIRGEEFLAKPEVGVRKTAAWLGLRTDEEAVEAAMHPERSPYANLGPPGARLGNDPSFLRDPSLRRPSHDDGSADTLEGPLSWRADGGGFSAELRAMAREFGYR
jgi:hypothetical protein